MSDPGLLESDFCAIRGFSSDSAVSKSSVTVDAILSNFTFAGFLSSIISDFGCLRDVEALKLTVNTHARPETQSPRRPRATIPRALPIVPHDSENGHSPLPECVLARYSGEICLSAQDENEKATV